MASASTGVPPRDSTIPTELERAVRTRLEEVDGDVHVRFRLRGGAVGWEVLDDPPTASVGHGARPEAFSAWLQRVLREQRISQDVAARRIGVSLKTVNRWVNGRTEPRMRELRRIQEAFGVPPL